MTLEARCDIGEVEALSALRDALFMPDASGQAPRGRRPARGHAARVSVNFGEELLEVYADGRRVDRANGQETEQDVERGPRERDPRRSRRDRLGEAAQPALLTHAHRSPRRRAR